MFVSDLLRDVSHFQIDKLFVISDFSTTKSKFDIITFSLSIIPLPYLSLPPLFFFYLVLSFEVYKFITNFPENEWMNPLFHSLKLSPDYGQSR